MSDAVPAPFSGPADRRAAVAAIVLAAGGSSRLGRPKQLLPYRGRTLLRHCVEEALASACRPVIVVLGADADRCRDEVAPLDVIVTLNEAWAEGMASSIRVGLDALHAVAPQADGALMLLCDQPFITATLLDTLVARHADGGGFTVATEYAGEPGVPALFPRARFAELGQLDGATGAKRLLRVRPAEVVTVPWPDAEVDIDTMADYDALYARPSAGSR